METPGDKRTYTSLFPSIDPSDYLKRGRWESWFTRPRKDTFHGNVENAVSLLVGIGEGIHYIFEKFDKKVDQTLYPPQFAFVFEDGPRPMIGTSNEGKYVVVKWAFLESRSNRDIHKIEPIHRGEEVAFMASTLDIFRLAGVEEGHHSIFFQTKPEAAWGSEANSSMTVAQYRARTIEYLPLIWQIRFAKEKGLPAETIAHLESKHREARQLRVGSAHS